MDELRIGVVGPGARGGCARHFHRRGRGVRIAAVTDPDDLLGRDLDAVIVLTPDDTHAGIAEAFLEAGVAVYLEKPEATSIEDCDRLLAAPPVPERCCTWATTCGTCP